MEPQETRKPYKSGWLFIFYPGNLPGLDPIAVWIRRIIQVGLLIPCVLISQTAYHAYQQGTLLIFASIFISAALKFSLFLEDEEEFARSLPPNPNHIFANVVYRFQCWRIQKMSWVHVLIIPAAGFAAELIFDIRAPLPLKACALILVAFLLVLNLKFDWGRYIRNFPRRVVNAWWAIRRPLVFFIPTAAVGYVLWYGQNYLRAVVPWDAQWVSWALSGLSLCSAAVAYMAACGVLFAGVYALLIDGPAGGDPGEIIANQNAATDSRYASAGEIDAALQGGAAARSMPFFED